MVTIESKKCATLPLPSKYLLGKGYAQKNQIAGKTYWYLSGAQYGEYQHKVKNKKKIQKKRSLRNFKNVAKKKRD